MPKQDMAHARLVLVMFAALGTNSAASLALTGCANERPASGEPVAVQVSALVANADGATAASKTIPLRSKHRATVDMCRHECLAVIGSVSSAKHERTFRKALDREVEFELPGSITLNAANHGGFWIDLKFESGNRTDVCRYERTGHAPHRFALHLMHCASGAQAGTAIRAERVQMALGGRGKCAKVLIVLHEREPCGTKPCDPEGVDDGNPCTTDGCGPNGPVFEPVSAGTPCPDDNLCNGAETCSADGQCASGTPLPLDDQNPCTIDSCDAQLGISHLFAATGLACDNDNACDGVDTCDGLGRCVPGLPPVVDDGNPCTIDSCDAELGISHSPAIGLACDNDDACDGVNTCDGLGRCVPGSSPQFDDGNPCTIDSCDALQGISHSPAPFGQACDNDDACDGVDTCDGLGLCVRGAPPQLDDGNPCTIDFCDPRTGPMHAAAPVGTSCEDTDLCNGSETCTGGGQCQAGVALSCDDDSACNGTEGCRSDVGCIAGVTPVLDDRNPCTADACDHDHGPTHTPLPDGTPCTPLACGEGTSSGQAPCAIGQCRLGVCGTGRILFNTGVDDSGVALPGGGVDPHYTLIRSAESTLPGPDAIVTTDIAEGYWVPQSAASKWIAPSANQSYPGANPCNAIGTYVYRTSLDLTGYDPNRFRIMGRWGADNFGIDVRLNGVSVGVEQTGYKVLAPFTIDRGFVDGVNTLDFELQDISCPNGLRVELSYSFSSTDQGNRCLGEVCENGMCTIGQPPELDDKNPCTVDACDPVTGVYHTLVAEGTSCADATVCNGNEQCDAAGHCLVGTPLACDDADACNGAESCDPLAGCVAGRPLDCDDANPCTGIEVCDPGVGCVPGTPIKCADADACNGAEWCHPNLGCVPGTPVICDDANLCNGLEICEPSMGCVPGTPIACDDADACNGIETCVPGAGCVAGVPAVIDDSNLCTADACDPTTGVIHTLLAEGTPCAATGCDGDEGACVGKCYSGLCVGPGPRLFNTGVDDNGEPLPGGSVDPHYLLVQSPDTAYPGPNAVVTSSIAEGYWVPQGPLSQWIAPTPDQSYPRSPEPCLATGIYVYRTLFDLTGIDSERFRIVGEWGADNYGVAIRINGKSIGGQSTSYNPLVAFTIDDGFVAGVNTLDFELEDISCPNGLHIEMSYSIDPDGGICGSLDCDDDDACNGVETCDPEMGCISGSAPQIDDSNPCTVDACDPIEGVTHARLPYGTPCGNGLECYRDGWCGRINQSPVVQLETDFSIPLGSQEVALTSMINDDGLPPLGEISYLWTLVSGPARVEFANPTAPTTSVRFISAGQYEIALTVSDSDLSGADSIVVTVLPEANANQPPAVSAGADFTLALNEMRRLQGAVRDDGLPSAGMLTFEWTKVSGPGSVFFDSLNVDPVVSFDAAGRYVMRLHASDSELSEADDVAVDVTTGSSAVFTVSAGSDKTTLVQAPIVLKGLVSRDDTVTVLTLTWSQLSGPGAVEFSQTDTLETTVACSLEGEYVLRLTVTDGRVTISDDVTVIVRPESPYTRPPPIAVPGVEPPDLTGLPVMPDGRIQIFESVEGSVVVDMNIKDALTGKAACLATVIDCYVTVADLDSCVVHAPKCASTSYWQERSCCPIQCASQYEARRVAGDVSDVAFKTVFLTLPTCFPGVAELVGAP